MNKGSSNRRKALNPARELVVPKAKVEPLNVDDMVIVASASRKCHFKRLKYMGCPPITPQGCFVDKAELVDMNRDSFIRELYHRLNKDVNTTTYNHFKGTLRFIAWLDNEGHKVVGNDYFCQGLIDKYMIWGAKQVKVGTLSKSCWVQAKSGISWHLKQMGRELEAKKLPLVKGGSTPINPYKGFDLESEFKPVVRALFKAYKSLLNHFRDGTVPERHPLYDKALLSKEAKRRNLKGNALANHAGVFKRSISKSHPFNPIVKIAMLICYMFTGINTTPLARLKISDVSFKEVQGGKYILDSMKARANYQDQDNSIGFSKHAKEFIEGWLSVAIEMSNGNKDAPLFPYYTESEGVKFYSDVAIQPQSTVNKLLGRVGLPSVNASRFRKTKMDTIFRVTESVYLVSMAANNSMKVVAKTYANGTETEHENKLAASMDAKFSIAKGENVDSAIQGAKYKFGDVLDDYEYQRLREGKDRSFESRTPTGVRCNDNKKGAAQVIRKALNRIGVESSDDETLCTSFLDCFDCEHHALVADTTDIWLMLSFRETLQQLQQTPSINSMPENKYIKLFNTIESVLDRFKEKSEINYKQAEEKLKEAAHPLYSNVYSLNDLIEVFA